eukprot:TRINITY_DN25908_c0_g1_i1.p1 TRINITY_DN25908_c0_g1~~TRINITY_DN25908_c0_g1_i1.p1  ORF type:complete len:253 (-),score=66.06 TRINITY_DN25908_c0_g1_i1:174-932(-)
MSQGPPKRVQLTVSEDVTAQKRAKSGGGAFGMGLGGGFAAAVAASEREEPAFDSQLACDDFAAGVVGAKLESQDADKTSQPRCGWWQWHIGGVPQGPVHSNMLDLAKLDASTTLVAIAADVPTTGQEAVFEPGSGSARQFRAWTAMVAARGGSGGAGRQVLLRVRRSTGVQPGGAWLVGVLIRGEGGRWSAKAVDEVYPAGRLAATLPLRCKEFLADGAGDDVDAEGGKKSAEASAMDETRRMLEEAMKEGF